MAAAKRDDILLLQHAQQPGLQGQRHVADLIEKQDAAIGFTDTPRHTFAPCIGKGPALVAEQLRFDQRFRQGGAVHRNERAMAARADGVQLACKYFLAGTCFTVDQDRNAGVQHALGIGELGSAIIVEITGLAGWCLQWPDSHR